MKVIIYVKLKPGSHGGYLYKRIDEFANKLCKHLMKKVTSWVDLYDVAYERMQYLWSSRRSLSGAYIILQVYEDKHIPWIIEEIIEFMNKRRMFQYFSIWIGKAIYASNLESLEDIGDVIKMATD